MFYEQRLLITPPSPKLQLLPSCFGLLILLSIIPHENGDQDKLTLLLHVAFLKGMRVHPTPPLTPVTYISNHVLAFMNISLPSVLPSPLCNNVYESRRSFQSVELSCTKGLK